MSQAEIQAGPRPAAWNGRPQNPERDGTHWVQWRSGAEPTAARWVASEGHWLWPGDDNTLGAGWVAPQAEYLGPCLTPAETAKLLGRITDLEAAVERHQRVEAMAFTARDAARQEAAALRAVLEAEREERRTRDAATKAESAMRAADVLDDDDAYERAEELHAEAAEVADAAREVAKKARARLAGLEKREVPA